MGNIIIKRRFISVIIFFLIVFSINQYFNFNSIINASAYSEVNKCDEVLSFIEGNFDVFVNEYNKTCETDEKLKAEYIEYSAGIDLIESSSYGVYIDFNDDNGYAVISCDLEILDLNTVGDYTFLRSELNLHFSRYDGFVFKDSNGEYQRLIETEHHGLNMSPYYSGETDYKNSSIYTGQTAEGDGEIESAKINDYISERYPDYTYETKYVSLADTFDFSRQVYTSYYIRRECDSEGNTINDLYSSEGNCSLNSMFNIIRSWSKNKKISSIDYSSTTDISLSITSDALYNEWGQYNVCSSSSTNSSTKSNGDEEVDYYYWRPNYSSALQDMPNLYSNIRSYAISEYGYTPETGYYASDVPDTLEYVSKANYNINIEVEYTSTVTTAISALENGEAVYLSLNNSSTYGNHGVALIGYQEYSYTTGWWIFSQTKYAYFYQIADGWNDSAMYFDPNTDASPSISFCVLN